jgi:hypothetical protein
MAFGSFDKQERESSEVEATTTGQKRKKNRDTIARRLRRDWRLNGSDDDGGATSSLVHLQLDKVGFTTTPVPIQWCACCYWYAPDPSTGLVLCTYLSRLSTNRCTAGITISSAQRQDSTQPARHDGGAPSLKYCSARHAQPAHLDHLCRFW